MRVLGAAEEIDATRGTWSDVERVKDERVEVGNLASHDTLTRTRSSRARIGEDWRLDHV